MGYIHAEGQRAVVVSVFRNDAKVKIKHAAADRRGGGVRSKVKEFSKASRQNLLFTAFNARAEFKTFVTLTYPNTFPCDGATVKAHLNSFLSALRFRVQTETGGPFRYMWAMEFQKRGAPHLHILIETTIPKGWLSKEWYQVVGSGDVKHLKAGTSIEKCRDDKGAGFYMARHYGAKAEQKAVPSEFLNVGRFWGSSRELAGPLQVVELLPGDRMTKDTVRTLRRFTEHELKRCYLAKRRRETKAGNISKGMRPRTRGEMMNVETGEIVPCRRKRAVRRPKRLANIRGALGVTFAQGFKVQAGAKVAKTLLERGGKGQV